MVLWPVRWILCPPILPNDHACIVAPSDITQTPCRAVTAQPPTRIKLLMRSRGLLPLRVTVDIRTAREVHADTVATRRETYISWNIYHAETSRDSQQLVSRAGQSLRSKVTLEWGSILEREKERRVKRVLCLYLLLRNDRSDSFSPTWIIWIARFLAKHVKCHKFIHIRLFFRNYRAWKIYSDYVMHFMRDQYYIHLYLMVIQKLWHQRLIHYGNVKLLRQLFLCDASSINGASINANFNFINL